MVKNPTSTQKQRGYSPLVIAHRGFSGNAPENTLAAIEHAINAGVDYVELDVRLSKDNTPVLMYDKDLQRTTNFHGSLRKQTHRELNELKAGFPSQFGDRFSGQNIPTLEEALRLAKGKVKIAVELKDRKLESM